MNSFTYKDTAIIESEFDFTRLDKGLRFSGEVLLSTTISIPKDPENNRTIILSLDITIVIDLKPTEQRVNLIL